MGAPLTARDVLDQLNADATGRDAAFFPDLDHGYYYHVDQRMSAYGGDGGRWVIVIEQLAVNPRGWNGGMCTSLYYHGNAVTLPEEEAEGQKRQRRPPAPVERVWPIEEGPGGPLFTDAVKDMIDPSAKDVRIRGQVVPIRTDENYYWARRIDIERLTNKDVDEMIEGKKNSSLPPEMLEIELKWIEEEVRPRVGKFELRTWHLMRGLVPEHRELLLATEEERRRGVPGDLRLLVQVDEWDHPRLMEGELPSGCESFKLIAKVLASGDPGLYRPTEEPNTHWSNWPLSGSL